MISVADALKIVLGQATARKPASVPISSALGLVLHEDIFADLDSPAWDKSMVDGYAVSSADLASGAAQLTIVEEVFAGQMPTQEVTCGNAIRIMTGAPIPVGCDAVVMVEKTKVVPGTTGLGIVEIEDRASPGQNILRRGAAIRRGDIARRRGQIIRPIEIGVLAELGRSCAVCVPRPRVGVLSTGNELIVADHVPAFGQIRNSNGPMLIASVAAAGGEAMDLGIARDEADALRERIEQGLTADVLIISGGVSAGVLDLVPRVLRELEVEQLFHKVQLKPGKPLWFGTSKTPSHQCLVFALPGNPVSSLVCFELFVRPALAVILGRGNPIPAALSAHLTAEFKQRGDRPTYHPGYLSRTNGRLEVAPLRWQGSADLSSLARANALVHFPAGGHQFNAGAIVEVIEL